MYEGPEEGQPRTDSSSSQGAFPEMWGIFLDWVMHSHNPEFKV